MTDATRSWKELLECPLCMKLFLEPVSLPCGHSFCRVCLRRCFQVNSACPMCRNVYLLEPDNLGVTITLSRLIQTHFGQELEERKKEVDEEERDNSRKTLPLFFDTERDTSTLGFVPGQQVTLRMFERRYKTLVQRSHETNRLFGIQKSPESRIGTVAEIIEVHETATGDYMISIKITHRYRVDPNNVHEEPNTGGLHVAQVYLFEDERLVAEPQEEESTGNTIPPTELAKRLHDIIRNTYDDLRHKIGPHNAVRLARELGSPPNKPSLISFYSLAAFSLPKIVKHDLFESTDTIVRLKAVYLFLAKFQEDKEQATRIGGDIQDTSNLVAEAQALDDSQISPLGSVNPQALSLYEEQGWTMHIDKALYQPTIGDSAVIVIIAIILLLLFRGGFLSFQGEY